MKYFSIDADTEKNGVACFDTDTKKLSLHVLNFAQLFSKLEQFHKEKTDVLILLENCWENKHDYHDRTDIKHPHFYFTLGADVGRVQGVGMCVNELLNIFQLKHELIRPLPKIWNELKDRKISRNELENLCKNCGVELLNNQKSNKDMRDAALLIINHIYHIFK